MKTLEQKIESLINHTIDNMDMNDMIQFVADNLDDYYTKECSESEIEDILESFEIEKG